MNFANATKFRRKTEDTPVSAEELGPRTRSHPVAPKFGLGAWMLGRQSAVRELTRQVASEHSAWRYAVLTRSLRHAWAPLAPLCRRFSAVCSPSCPATASTQTLHAEQYGAVSGVCQRIATKRTLPSPDAGVPASPACQTARGDGLMAGSFLLISTVRNVEVGAWLVGLLSAG